MTDPATSRLTEISRDLPRIETLSWDAAAHLRWLVAEHHRLTEALAESEAAYAGAEDERLTLEAELAHTRAVADAARDLLAYDPKIAWPDEADFTPLIQVLAALDQHQKDQ